MKQFENRHVVTAATHACMKFVNVTRESMFNIHKMGLEEDVDCSTVKENSVFHTSLFSDGSCSLNYA